MTIKLTAGEDVYDLDFDPAHHATAEEAAKAYAAALRRLGYAADLMPPDAASREEDEQHWAVACEGLPDDDCVHGG
ncbi:MAG: hypothetical protein WAO69_17725 [Aestuariivita sp.]|uniref:hypothetical protein n=1 Tax=Aestuariivita sp. TaxID=1872407 RepID=UPI003BAF6EB7